MLRRSRRPGPDSGLDLAGRRGDDCPALGRRREVEQRSARPRSERGTGCRIRRRGSAQRVCRAAGVGPRGDDRSVGLEAMRVAMSGDVAGDRVTAVSRTRPRRRADDRVGVERGARRLRRCDRSAGARGGVEAVDALTRVWSVTGVPKPRRAPLSPPPARTSSPRASCGRRPCRPVRSDRDGDVADVGAGKVGLGARAHLPARRPRGRRRPRSRRRRACRSRRARHRRRRCRRRQLPRASGAAKAPPTVPAENAGRSPSENTASERPSEATNAFGVAIPGGSAAGPETFTVRTSGGRRSPRRGSAARR